MSSIIDTLIDMGFPKERVEIALAKTNSQDIQTIMDWILSHAQEDEVDVSATPTELNPLSTEANTTTDEVEAASANAVPVQKSIKCDDCGKLFKNDDEVMFHASKTGHDKFSASTEEKKPLSEEEKKEQLAKIEAKLRQRRLEREAREKEEALEREKARIKSGKDLLEAKKKHEELEMKKIIEQRKREKEEERLARQRVRDQIEADKLTRKAKFAATQNQTIPQAPAAATPVSPLEKKSSANYTEVKLQIRLMDGKVLVQNFGIKEPLSAVRCYVEMNQTNGDGPFKLMTSFPRKVFEADDYDKPLASLDLAPTATLFVCKT